MLTGRRYTTHYAVGEELKEIIASEKVVLDDRILTSRGAGTALDFGLAMVALLVGQDKADEIAHSICA